MPDIVLVLTTVSDSNNDRADSIARALIEDHLAACVNVHAPMTSFYRWKGAVERDPERQVVIKTTRERLPALEARLKELHSYELPEFLVMAIDGGSAEYMKWVDDVTRSG